MKRGRDDERVLGPMFPRLHVNDTEKGGPRAPPRNKMALYEQFSIPSQRFNLRAFPSIANDQANSGQKMCYPLDMHQSALKNLSGNSKASKADEVTCAGQRKNTEDEDDFTVPVFVQSRNNQCDNEKSKAKEKGMSMAKPTRAKSSRGNNLDKSRFNLIPEAGCQSKNHFGGKIHRRSSDVSSKDPATAETNEVSTPSSRHTQGQVVENFSTSHELNAKFSQRCDGSIQSEDGFSGSTRLRGDSQPQGAVSHPANITVLHEQCRDSVDVFLPSSGTVRGDDTSEASIIDSVPVIDISPDDVVGVIGQKQFWKARKLIVNDHHEQTPIWKVWWNHLAWSRVVENPFTGSSSQQMAFAGQVFELHRLIKVQKLIAESPHLLIEDASAFGKSSIESSPANKFPIEHVTKHPSSVAKEKEEAEKQALHHVEYSAENSVVKTLATSTRTTKPCDVSMGPWSYPQVPGHQWLIPVMSPSEGLIYKPFPAPGFSGPICGGYGPYSSPPLMGNLPNPAYGFPIHQPGPGYFPSHGMPAMSFSVSSSSLEQANQFSAPVTCSQTGQAAREGADKLQHPGSFGSILKEKRTKIRPSKASELQQGSTGSSLMDQTEALATFPVYPSATMAELPTRVIKVVPHNPRSATESAARIFRSIQEERKRYDSA